MPTPAELFQQLISDEWEARLAADPLFATFTGDRRYNDRLPDVSEAATENWLHHLQSLRQRQQAIDPAPLPAADRLNYAIFARLLEDEIARLGFRAYRMPVSKMSGLQNDFPQLWQFVPLDTITDYENYLARLAGFPAYVEGHIDVMRTGLHSGHIAPRVTLEGITESLRTHLVSDPAKSQLYAPFTRFPERFTPAERARLEQSARRVIEQSVLPGFGAFLQFFEGEYLPKSRPSTAARDLPDGAAYYQYCVQSFTSLPLTAEAVHQTGLAEVGRIRAEMEGVLQQVGFVGSFGQFVEFLRSDPQFYAKTPEELLSKTALILKRMDGELPRLFKTLPRLPYGIRAVPDFAAPGNTTAYYQPGAGDGSRAGYYYVNTYDLPSRPLYEMEALSLHEAVPGHHLQIALQQELDLPNFRRFNGFTAFVEGWALYSERLGLETGFYTDPYSNFGRLSYEMWRALRLVVDTGLHALGWSRQQAIEYMLANSSSTVLNITNEVDRYIAWPGQALAYKIGELKIRSLRQRAEETLGSRFDLRTFHDVLLRGGALPLDVLETAVMEYIAQA